jgi:hypothetical protein
MFVSKTGACLSGEPFWCFQLQEAPGLNRKYYTDCKGVQGTNSPAYLARSLVTKKKVLEMLPMIFLFADIIIRIMIIFFDKNHQFVDQGIQKNITKKLVIKIMISAP